MLVNPQEVIATNMQSNKCFEWQISMHLACTSHFTRLSIFLKKKLNSNISVVVGRYCKMGFVTWIKYCHSCA